MNYQELTGQLLEQQQQEWDLLKTNLDGLAETRIRNLTFDGFRIRMQYNARRIRSSGARVDKVSIDKRPCFLCRKNRPEAQRAVAMGTDYEILCNPYPIFQDRKSVV